MMCIDYNPEIVKGILLQLDKREEENVDFDEFLTGIRTILMYDSYFDEMESIFKHLDFQKRNRIKRDDLLKTVNKLRDESIGPHEIRVPPVADLERICSTIVFEESDGLNYEEFQLVMYRATLEDE